MKKLIRLLTFCLVILYPWPAAARSACTGKCWPVGDCYACGFTAFLGAVCYDSHTGDTCICEEYACPTASASWAGQDQIAEEHGTAKRGSSKELKVLHVRLLEPRV